MPTHLTQTTLQTAPFNQNPVPNLEPAGNTLPLKSDGALRIGFQNIRGTSDLRGLSLPSKIEAIEEFEIDIMGMAETNRPWSLRQRSTYDAFMTMKFRSA